MYKTEYALFHHSRTYIDVYIGIGNTFTCMYKAQLNKTAFIKAGVVQSEEHYARNI